MINVVFGLFLRQHQLPEQIELLIVHFLALNVHVKDALRAGAELRVVILTGVEQTEDVVLLEWRHQRLVGLVIILEETRINLLLQVPDSRDSLLKILFILQPSVN